MNVGFRVIKDFNDGRKIVRPVKLLSTGPVDATEEFLIETTAEGVLRSVWKRLEEETVMTAPRRLPVNYRMPCKKHVAKIAEHVTTSPEGSPGQFRLYLAGSPITDGAVYVPREHREKLLRYYVNHGELYRIARDRHRIGVRLSTTEGYNLELVMDAVANGATPVHFDNGDGVSMSAFFVMGSEWVHTVSSIPELNFGIGVVETSFIDFFKGVVMPYIEAE